MRLSRRRWIVGLLGLLVWRPSRGVLLSLTGCGSSESSPPDSVLRLKASEVPAEGRIKKVHQMVPVEFRREGGEIRARSLLCTHQRCHVEWMPEERRYLCPCHEGLFAADGSVVYGPPQRPLRELTLEIHEDEVWVDTHQVYRAVGGRDSLRTTNP